MILPPRRKGAKFGKPFFSFAPWRPCWRYAVFFFAFFARFAVKYPIPDKAPKNTNQTTRLRRRELK